MRISNTLVLTSEDLKDGSKDKLAKEITSNDLTRSWEMIAISEIVMFVDKYSQTRILKNRWGITGMVYNEN